MGEIFQHALIYSLSDYYIIFKILPVIAIGLAFSDKKLFSGILMMYAGFNYAVIALVQNAGFTEKYGFGIVLSNVILFLLTAFAWMFELLVSKTDIAIRNKKSIWIIFPAIFAFAYPAGRDFLPELSLLAMMFNESGMTFCMMTPVYLTVLILSYPVVNNVTLRITSLTGFIIALFNINVNFILFPEKFWWIGVLHIPLLVISLTGLILVKRPAKPRDSAV